LYSSLSHLFSFCPHSAPCHLVCCVTRKSQLPSWNCKEHIRLIGSHICCSCWRTTNILCRLDQYFFWHICSDKSKHSPRRPSHEQLEDSVWLASLKASDASALKIRSWWSASIVLRSALAIAVVTLLVAQLAPYHPMVSLLWFGKVRSTSYFSDWKRIRAAVVISNGLRIFCRLFVCG
jgi:hypothetical protein